MNPSPEPAFAQECAAFERLSMSDPLRAASEGDALLARIRACDDAAAFAHVSRSMANALAHVGRAHESIRRAAEARRFSAWRPAVVPERRIDVGLSDFAGTSCAQPSPCPAWASIAKTASS